MAKGRSGRATSTQLPHGQTADNRSPAAWQEQLYSTLYACPHCKISFEELEPRTFSFNSPYGACPACEGLGSRVQFDPELVLFDDSLSLAAGAMALGKDRPAPKRAATRRELRRISQSGGHRPGNADRRAEAQSARTTAGTATARFPGVLTLLERRIRHGDRSGAPQAARAFRGTVVCTDCGGARLRPEARACRFAAEQSTRSPP